MQDGVVCEGVGGGGMLLPLRMLVMRKRRPPPPLLLLTCCGCCSCCRGYSGKKLDDNIECEIMQVILDEAKESYRYPGAPGARPLPCSLPDPPPVLLPP